MAEYQDSRKITQVEATRIFSRGSKEEICEALVGISFYHEDWKWSQDQCLRFLNDADPDIKRVAAICLGHIARVHGCLDREQVVSALKMHVNDQEIAGSIQDALDDIEMFVREKGQ